MRRVLRSFTVVFLFCLAAVPALAVLPDEVLADPALEARARAISKELRCVVCQNQAIDDSNAPLARDMRILVREHLTAGDSDAEVKEYLVARYGNFVLLRPPVQPNTVFLWGGPLLFLSTAFAGFALYLRKSKKEILDAPSPLAADEEEQLRRISEKTA